MTRKEYLIRQKEEKGRKLFGIFPAHYPKEILWAMNVLPVEIWDPPLEVSHANAHLQPYICSVVKLGLELILQVKLDEMGDSSLNAVGEVRISSVCTVFAESEVISLVAKNHPKEEIIRGLHRSIVNRVWSMLSTIGVQGSVTMSAGVAKNKGVVSLMEEKLGRAIHDVHTEPQIVGALGAALLSQRKVQCTG